MTRVREDRSLSAMTPSIVPPDRAARLLFDRYCDCIDQRHLDELSTIFTEDCDVRFGHEQVEGIDALLVFLRTGLGAFAQTKHVVTDIELERDARLSDRFLYQARVVAWHRFVKNRPHLTIHGQYRGVILETEAGWRLAQHLGSETRRENGIGPPTIQRSS